MKIFNIMFPNTCSRNKRRKNCEESRWRSQSALVRPLAMSCLSTVDAKISLVPKHQLTVPSILLALATNIRTYKDTKIQSYKDTKIQRYKATKIHTLTPLTYELFFQNNSNKTAPRGAFLAVLRTCMALQRDLGHVKLDVCNHVT